MATILYESSTVDITLMNDEMGETTFKINNPADNLTLAQIREYYSTVIPGSIDGTTPQLLFDKNNRPFKVVAKAVVTQTQTYKTELE